jgi:hypothetical protein
LVFTSRRKTVLRRPAVTQTASSEGLPVGIAAGLEDGDGGDGGHLALDAGRVDAGRRRTAGAHFLLGVLRVRRAVRGRLRGRRSVGRLLGGRYESGKDGDSGKDSHIRDSA